MQLELIEGLGYTYKDKFAFSGGLGILVRGYTLGNDSPDSFDHSFVNPSPWSNAQKLVSMPASYLGYLNFALSYNLMRLTVDSIVAIVDKDLVKMNTKGQSRHIITPMIGFTIFMDIGTVTSSLGNQFDIRGDYFGKTKVLSKSGQFAEFAARNDGFVVNFSYVY